MLVRVAFLLGGRYLNVKLEEVVPALIALVQAWLDRAQSRALHTVMQLRSLGMFLINTSPWGWW